MKNGELTWPLQGISFPLFCRYFSLFGKGDPSKGTNRDILWLRIYVASAGALQIVQTAALAAVRCVFTLFPLL